MMHDDDDDDDDDDDETIASRLTSWHNKSIVIYYQKTYTCHFIVPIAFYIISTNLKFVCEMCRNG